MRRHRAPAPLHVGRDPGSKGGRAALKTDAASFDATTPGRRINQAVRGGETASREPHELETAGSTPARATSWGCSSAVERSPVERVGAGSIPAIPVVFSSWWPWCSGSTRGRDPRGAGSIPAGHPFADAHRRSASQLLPTEAPRAEAGRLSGTTGQGPTWSGGSSPHSSAVCTSRPRPLRQAKLD